MRAADAARVPFHFLGCWELREMLGRRASDERALLVRAVDSGHDGMLSRAGRTRST